MKILAIGAHPDDVEVCCFGTLAKFAQESLINEATTKENNKIFIAVTCKGNAGTKELNGEQITKIRSQEAKKAADLINAEYINLGFGDGQVFFNQESLTTFINLIRKIEPEIIITHPPIEKAAAIFYFEQFPGGFEGPITHYVDITSTFEIKKKALSFHQSQIQFTKKLGGVDMLEEMELTAKKRGMECGALYAEAFQELTKYPHVRAKRFLP